jgi:hypothetical protein
VGKRKHLQDHPELLGVLDVRKLWQTQELLSDHYLKARLSKNDWWPADDVARPVWEFCRDLYNKRYLALAKNNEAFTRQEFIDKVLDRLGFAWTDNLGLPNQDAEPDYILFTSAAEKESVLDQDTASRYRAAATILEAKKLHHPLSQVSKHQQRYPHQQIRDYLQDAQVLSWGILTNGNEWRLYCRDARRQDFFALNFEVAIQSLESFRFFLTLFSPDAFQRDAKGKCRLDLVREQSISAQSELEEDLRQRIFTVLTDLANGFASRLENQIPDTDDGRKALYENCLIYLYRLLFLLYAEGRGLLPVEPRTRRYYKELSLERLKPDLKNFAGYDSHTRTRLSEDISELFHLVNGTDEAKNKEYSVARYNGGLFDPEQHPLLENWRIADADMASVLRGLMFDPPPKPNEPALPILTVDFGDLRVQQIGSIYEGLLEHHFVRNADGRLELRTDKAERKATGTYYTPDYIVKYIVEQTLTPLLDEIEQSEPVKGARAASRQDNSFANGVLALNVCDPAMGSGHFLVEATTFLADHIAAHPTTRRLHEKSKDEEELAYWRRRVVEACIYGVDLNPLAVELAKLSLWLTCIASDQPLNFLDHHLRCGNSLIGARLDQLGSLPEKKPKRGATARQIAFTFGPDFKRAVAETIRQIQKIESESSKDVAAVKNKEQRWQSAILPGLARYKKVANLWTNTFFDGPLSEEEYLAAANEILVVERAADSLRETPTRHHVKELGKPYFHWELEFPDVFFDNDGSPKAAPGFEAVIGNPPWGMLQPHNTEPPVLDYLRTQFECSEFKVDMFQLFLEQGLHFVRKQHQLGMIVPNTLLTNTYCQRVRRMFIEQTAIRFLGATTEMVFPSADVHPALIIARKTRAKQGDKVGILVHETDERFEKVLARHSLAWLPQDDLVAFDGNSWNVRLNAGFARLVRTLTARSRRLGELAFVKRGLISGNREKYFASEKRGPRWHPIITGTDVQRYAIQLPTEYVLFEKPGRAAGGCWDADVHLKRGKILLKQVGRWPQAAVDEAPYCITGNVFALILRTEQLSSHYVAALLNSTLTRVVWSVVLSDFKAVFPELKGEWIERWPIRSIEFSTATDERAGLLAKAQELYAGAVAANDVSGLLAFVEGQITAKPERGDVVHDLLAFLAEQMMDFNQRQRTAARQFLTDLKDFHGIDARALNPKTRLDEFWKLETAEVFAHVHKNRKVLAAAKVDLNEAAEDKIRSRFEQAKSAILPLEAQIALTDELIDQVVYRLYALTPEEIKLVETAQVRPPADAKSLLFSQVLPQPS